MKEKYDRRINMKYCPIKTMVMVVLVLLVISVFVSYAQAPQQTLTQYISDLQKNPNDYALREKIINHVQTMRPVPKTSEQAAIHERALLVAPWLATFYFNCGIA